MGPEPEPERRETEEFNTDRSMRTPEASSAVHSLAVPDIAINAY